MVSHGHVAVNNRKVNISSFNLRAGDVVTVKDRPASRRLATRNLELTQIQPIPDWLVVDKDQFQGKVVRIPTREEIAPIVNEQLVVELYSRYPVGIGLYRSRWRNSKYRFSISAWV